MLPPLSAKNFYVPGDFYFPPQLAIYFPENCRWVVTMLFRHRFLKTGHESNEKDADTPWMGNLFSEEHLGGADAARASAKA